MTNQSPLSEQSLGGIDHSICPFLGLPGDSTTHYQYPSRVNYCHIPDNPEPVQLKHQENYCLTSNHTECPVFLRANTDRLPPEIRASSPGSRPTFWGRVGPALGIVGILGVIAILAFLVFPLETPASIAASRTPTLFQTSIPPVQWTDTPDANAAPSIAASPTPTPTLSPTILVTQRLTPTPVPPTASPTFFPTPGPGPGTPFGHSPQFVIHLVQEGESFTGISARYGTTNEVLEAINLLVEGQSLWVGRQIVVPVGVTDAEGLPKFRVYLVPENTTVEALAEQFSASEDEIRQYNSLGPKPEIPAGRWLIIPVTEA